MIFSMPIIAMMLVLGQRLMEMKSVFILAYHMQIIVMWRYWTVGIEAAILCM